MFVQALRSEKGALHEEEAKLIRFERWVLKDWIRTETFLKSFRVWNDSAQEFLVVEKL